jgi:hypothetical protein
VAAATSLRDSSIANIRRRLNVNATANSAVALAAAFAQAVVAAALSVLKHVF